MSAETSRGPAAGDLPGEVCAFLRDLRGRGRPAAETELPELESRVRQVSARDDLAGRFCQAAKNAGMRVHRVENGDWITPVRGILSECGAKSIYLEPGAGAGCGLERLVEALKRAAIAIHSDASDETMFSVDAAITGVERAVAETGTLVCSSGPQRARGGSLIPPLHIALVRTTQIVPDLYDCLAGCGAGPNLPANINLITGPSKTADIEGILVTGVHGPR